MTTRLIRIAGAALALGLTATGLAACGDDTSGSGSTDSGAGDGSGGKKIALLLPENKTTRYEAFDKPLFEEAVKAGCADCEVLYSNAEQDDAKQQQQVEAAITQGVDVLVLDAVDGKSAVTIVQNAKSQGIPVIAYDRFIAGADYYMSFDNETVGELQGQAPRRRDGPRQGLRRHPHDQRLAHRPQRRRTSRRARTASSTPAATRSTPSTTTPTGAPTTRSRDGATRSARSSGRPRRRLRRQRRHRRAASSPR